MKAKFVTVGVTVEKHTYDRVEAKYPFDKVEVYSPVRQTNANDIRDMLEAAYEAGRRHIAMEIKTIVGDIR